MLSRRHQSPKNNAPESEIKPAHAPSDMFGRTRFWTRFKRWLWTKYGLVFLTASLVILTSEVLCYQWSKWYWPDIDALVNKPTVQKLLLIADPQLIGEKDEGFFGSITRRDADRYLAKTFSQANAYVQPDWILFLGDIFDEGLSATDDEFKRYFERFDTIFQYETREDKCIAIPGDNDVGGEYYGDKQPVLRQRFRNYFGRMIQLYRKNDLEYLKLDIDMFESYVGGKRSAIMEQTQERPLNATFRIVLNHWPILSRSTRFIKPFVNELEPNLILKGDSHHFSVTSYDRVNVTARLLARETIPRTILPIDLHEHRFIYEISVPTCSYRMGVNRIGYGMLLLDSATKTAHLLLLHTPRRYIFLYLYAAYSVCFVLFVIVTFLLSRRSRTPTIRH